jgi:dihydroorotase
VIDLYRLVELYTVNPARLLGLDAGTLTEGQAGDVTVIDPGLEWTVDREQSFSLSRNNPFHGWELKGRAVRTIVSGKSVWNIGQ